MANERDEAQSSITCVITHDLNNLMTAVIAYSELYRFAGDVPEDARRAFQDIFEAGTRAAELTRRLTEISHHQHEPPGDPPR